MLRPAPHIRYHIAAILTAHWIQFVVQYKRWIRPVVFENVRKVLACRTPVLGCHIYQCKGCGHVELIPHSCNPAKAGLPYLRETCHRCLVQSGTQSSFRCALPSLDYGHPMAITYRHHNESSSWSQSFSSSCD